MSEAITSIDPLLGGASNIAWVSYPHPSDSFCYVYPQYACASRGYVEISPEAFPDRGAIYASIAGGDTAGSIRSRYGEVVVATINADGIENRRYDGESIVDRSFAILNEHYTSSMIEFTKIEAHPAARDLVQVVELADAGLSLDEPLSKPVELAIDQASPLTSWIMVEQAAGSQLVYWGPFTTRKTSAGSFELDATAEFKGHVLRLDATQIGDVMTVERRYDEYGAAARFMSRAVLNQCQRRMSSLQVIDWVSDEDLMDAVASVVKKTSWLGMGTEEASRLRRAISECNMVTAGIYMTDERKARMANLLEEPWRWAEKVDVLSAALTRPPASEKLVELALSEEHFDRVKDLFVDSEAIQAQVEEERQRYRTEAKRARAARDEALAAKEQAQRELDEGRAQLGKLREEALREVSGKIDEAHAELDRALRETTRAEEELAALEAQAARVAAELDGTSEAVARRVVESRVFGCVSGTLAGVAAGARVPEGEEDGFAFSAPREDEGPMSPAEVAECVHRALAEGAGRNALGAADVVNLLTCVMGSPMTVLSGMPGTGKTSLAVALAGALGLSGADRFAKIAVERGWTSHRDYVGYYSPLTGRLEASNTAVFRRFCALDEELRASGAENGVDGRSIPYLMLLDEANMSVVENYWSPFLSNADDFLARPTELSMQGGPVLRVPSFVRWISTVNYDHTTEALSARFLNRAWVINVESADASVDELLSSEALGDFSRVAPFSYAKLMEAFGPKPDARIEDAGARRRMVELFDECAKATHPVSYRCRSAIARYVAVAEPVMREFAGQGAQRALDYAFAQRVLPSINGVGEPVREFLEKLADECVGLEVSRGIIEHMITAGKDDGFYQFFA